MILQSEIKRILVLRGELKGEGSGSGFCMWQSPPCVFFFFLVWTIFEVFIGSVTILLLFYVSGFFWLQGVWFWHLQWSASSFLFLITLLIGAFVMQEPWFKIKQNMRTNVIVQRTLISGLWWLSMMTVMIKGKEIQGRGDICTHIADSLCCAAENDTTL